VTEWKCTCDWGDVIEEVVLLCLLWPALGLPESSLPEQIVRQSLTVDWSEECGARGTKCNCGDAWKNTSLKRCHMRVVTEDGEGRVAEGGNANYKTLPRRIGHSDEDL
jgi:hypothetical protein